MTERNNTPSGQLVRGLAALVALVAVAGAAVWGLSLVLTGSVGGAVAGGLVALVVAVVSKRLDHQKQRETAIAEKKREVYRRLLAPWERVMVDTKAGKQGDELLANVDLAAVYSSAFDAVLYGSEEVVLRYGRFRTPAAGRDGIDTMRALASLLLAMREDVTGRKSGLTSQTVLGTFMNLSEEELMVLQLRDYVAGNPEAQEKLAKAIAGHEGEASEATAADNTSPGHREAKLEPGGQK